MATPTLTEDEICMIEDVAGHSYILGTVALKLIEEIRRLQEEVKEWQRVGNEIMIVATGKPSPLSDSDVCGEINKLRDDIDNLKYALDCHQR